MTTVKNIYDYINSFAPFDTQEEWDNSGFLIGDFRKEVKKCVLSLDGTKDVVQFACDIGADLIITHHPMIFSGLKNLEAGAPAFECVKNGISVISAHTNYDKADGGVNDVLCQRLGIKNTYRCENGFLTVGEIENEMSIDDFAQFVGDTLGSAGLRYTDTEKAIKRVAVCGGAGESEFIDEASSVADCYVTGDCKYHEMLGASEKGFAVISAGHFETEIISIIELKSKLEKIFTDVEFTDAEQKNSVLGV